MSLTSLHFLAFVSVSWLLFQLRSSAAWRKAVLLGMALYFTSTHFSDFAQMAPLLGFLALGFLGVALIPVGCSSRVLGTWIASIVIVFAVLKKYGVLEFLPTLPFAYSVVGLSYILFRVIHLSVDVAGRGIEPRPTGAEYLRYVLNPFTFVAGPIQRFQESRRQHDAFADFEVDDDVSSRSLSRIVNGYLKVAVISVLLKTYFDFLDVGQAARSYEHAVASAVYTAFLFFNFSGYMDIVIGVGGLFGLKLPENFDRPFTSVGFLEFWGRWHMTLSEWFKTYVFNPVVTRFTRLSNHTKLMPYYGVVGFFITFFLMGIWHGTTLAFVYYAVFLALGVSLNKLFEVQSREWLGKQRFKSLRANEIYRLVGQALTGAYFAYALACVWKSPDELVRFVHEYGAAKHFRSFVVCVAIFAGFQILVRVVEFLNRTAAQAPRALSWLWMNGLDGAKVMAILVFLSRRAEVPGFVYKVF